MSITYSSYLKIDELLSLQQPLSGTPASGGGSGGGSGDAAGSPPEHDETLFIIIHQVYELWFKQMIHEAQHLRMLTANRHHDAAGTLKRMLTILKTMVQQIDVLETMTPISFLSFRDRLGSSSGFQSHQFREFEFILGHKVPAALSRYPEGSSAHQRLKSRLADATVFDGFLRYLAANGKSVPQALLQRDVTQPIQANPELQKTLVDIYRHDPQVRQICELLVDLDEGIQEWRYRHVKMVERTIGFKQGTGGSPGAAYLRTTLLTPLFPDLWEIRTSL